MATEDISIIKQVLAGNRQAYRELVIRHQQKLYYFMLRRGLSNEDALDISQEAMITGYEKLAAFKGNSSFYTWICRIAINKLVDKIRKEKIEYVELDDNIAGELSHESLARDVESEEMMGYLRKAISTLPKQQKEVVNLRLIGNMQFNLIANQLNITEGGAKANYHKGIKNLRKILG